MICAVAKETGAIVRIKDDVRDVATAILVSRATIRKIKQNLIWALIYNWIGIPIAALGALNPIIAAAAMALFERDPGRFLKRETE